MNSENKVASYSSSEPYTDVTSIHIRMSNKTLVEKFKEFLTGKREEYIEEDGRIVVIQRVIGEAFCTDEIANQITNYLSLMTDPQVFQANLSDPQYGELLRDIRIGVAKYLFSIKEKTGMKTENIQYIVNQFMSFQQASLSGVVKGFKTEKLIPTIRTHETNNTIEEKQRGLFNRR